MQKGKTTTDKRETSSIRGNFMAFLDKKTNILKINPIKHLYIPLTPPKQNRIIKIQINHLDFNKYSDVKNIEAIMMNDTIDFVVKCMTTFSISNLLVDVSFVNSFLVS